MWGLALYIRRSDFLPRLLCIGGGMAEVVIYTQDWCPYCVRAKQVLTKKGVAFQEIDAPSGTAAREESFKRTGRRTIR